MQQILLVLVAIALGLAAGAMTGGFAFSPLVCIVAGVFLVTPSLFKFDLADMALAKTHRGIVARNLAINYLLLPVAALLIGLASRDFGIAGALFLLSLLPGGGMVMMWIKSSGANPKLGFILFMLNLALLLPVTLVFELYPHLAAGLFPPPELAGGAGAGTMRVQPFAPFMILIVLPFILSRAVRQDMPELMAFVERHQQTLSKATMFGIVFYLFSLTTAQMLFEVPLARLGLAALATLAFYAVAIAAAALLTPDTPEGRALYWHVVTRYITLALIFAVFMVDRFGPTFILPVMLAYFVQIGAAGVLRGRMLARPA